MQELPNEQEHYQQVDLPFYAKHVAPLLPETVLDFHTHIWTREHWKEVPWQTDAAGGKYMVTQTDYTVEQLLADGARIFPDRPYHAVCFGNPTPAADEAKTNDYVAEAGRRESLFPLMTISRDTLPRERILERLSTGDFYGYKVILNWHGNDYGEVRVEDMIGPAEMAIADERRLIVLLHVPRSERLADPEVQRGLRDLSRGFPRAQIVLAHCGRCYHPDRMKKAVPAISDLANVCLDASMVMEPLGLEMLFSAIDSSRVLFATDFPVAGMRGRRVYVMDHWVDLVLEGYPPSAYRVQSDDMHATFMAYEIVLAIARAADRAGLSEAQLKAIFHGNGTALLQNVIRK